MTRIYYESTMYTNTLVWFTRYVMYRDDRRRSQRGMVRDEATDDGQPRGPGWNAAQLLQRLRRG